MRYVNECWKIQNFIEYEDRHYITEADADVAVVAVADSTGLNEPKHTDVTQDRAQPGNDGEELPVGLAFDVQDMLLVQEGETRATPEAGLLVIK